MSNRGAPGIDGLAVRRAEGYIRDGRRWVVDMDLEKFFDRVNHDMLLHRVARRIEGRHVLTLIRRFLQVGLMADGVETARTQGTPQGGPLSPLLSNSLLTGLDCALERRGLALQPVRRRLQHLGVQRTRRAADRDRDHGVPRGASEAARERSQERGGAALATQVPGLHTA